MYRIRAYGPGRTRIPLQGPLLVVANHSAYLDPAWLAKLLPRRVTPMMTSVFFDRPLLRWLMAGVVQAIRVEWSRFRREIPELRQAIAALDRGECVLIFPEAWLRRKADVPIRQFGQGVWLILKERPATPVLVCWIEGGWGSFFSYCGGPPGVNKRLDWWRRIAIGFNEPQVLAPEMLADQRATRRYLMRLCAEARRYLGLEAYRLPQESSKEEVDADDD
jgi:1-acyl-sn-glycerol-3-phosphate acyltransferase